MKVACYKNLHNGMFSIQCREGENYGRVIAHAKKVFIGDPSFVVREKGRQKVLNERKKNVHAFVVGRLASFSGGHVRREYEHLVDELSWHYNNVETFKSFSECVEYNPYLYDSFVYAGKSGMVKVSGAHFALLDEDGVFVWNPENLD